MVGRGLKGGGFSHALMDTNDNGVADGTSRLTTSLHTYDGTSGTAWGNGALGTAGAGASIALTCGSCHNPHGNGQYRILSTHPGEDWTNGVDGVANWTAPLNGVEVADVGSTTTTKNYTVLPGVQAGDVTEPWPDSKWLDSSFLKTQNQWRK